MVEMQDAMARYFAAEKSESAFFIAAGLLAFGASALYFWHDTVYRGIVFPLVGVGLIQLVVGGTVFFRTDSQVKSLSARLETAPAEFRNEELARMETVNQNFRIYKIIEIALLAAGIALALWKRNDLLYSAGIGLILQAGLMLVFDLFAERRAEIYVQAIERLLP